MVTGAPEKPKQQGAEYCIRQKAPIASLSAIAVVHIQWGFHRRYSLTMTKTSYDVGVAGSITMIVLTVAVVVLLRSFYKRFTNVRKDDQE